MAVPERYSLVMTGFVVHAIVFSYATIVSDNLTSFGEEQGISSESILNISRALTHSNDRTNNKAVVSTFRSTNNATVSTFRSTNNATVSTFRSTNNATVSTFRSTNNATVSTFRSTNNATVEVVTLSSPNTALTDGALSTFETTSKGDDITSIWNTEYNSSKTVRTLRSENAEIPIAPSTDNVTTSPDRLMTRTTIPKTFPVSATTDSVGTSSSRPLFIGNITEEIRDSGTGLHTTPTPQEFNTDKDQLDTRLTKKGLSVNDTREDLNQTKSETSETTGDIKPIYVHDNGVDDGDLEKVLLSLTATKHAPTATQNSLHRQGIHLTTFSKSLSISETTDLNIIRDNKENVTSHFNIIPVFGGRPTSVLTTLTPTPVSPVNDTTATKSQTTVSSVNDTTTTKSLTTVSPVNDTTISKSPTTVSPVNDTTTTKSLAIVSPENDTTTTKSPTIVSPVNDTTITKSPTTVSSVNDTTTTKSLTTVSSVNDTTTTKSLTTVSPVNDTTISESPTTVSPVNDTTTTKSPKTVSLVNDTTTTKSPTIVSPVNDTATTKSPTTVSPVNDAITKSPKTFSPVNDTIPTKSPTTVSPVNDTTTKKSPTTVSPVIDTTTTKLIPLKPPMAVNVTPKPGQPEGQEWTGEVNKLTIEAAERGHDSMTTGHNSSTKSTKISTEPMSSPSGLTTSSPVVTNISISMELAKMSNMTEAKSMVRDTRLLTEYNPFVVIWNIPSRKCATTHGSLPKLSHYGIVHNKHQHFYGEKIVIFYANQLGFYPQILPNGDEVNGGVPQLANLDIHLAKARTDIEKRIPNQNFSGYAVIDWEAWRPIFRRNWGVQRIYKKRSVRAMEKYYPTWKYNAVKAVAKKKFDKAARNFMESTLTFAKSLRPRAKWGFYLFPDCYNFRDGQDYCHKRQMRRNDKLSWMFQASGALYPSIYLSQKMAAKHRAAHVKGILGEAYRIQETHTNKWSTPVLPYARLRYGDTDFLLSKEDLEGTIGQAATTGSSGIILWERYVNTVGKRKCFQLEKYVRTILGPYLEIVQNFVVTCSKTLCKNNGRCVRKKRVSTKGRSGKDQQKFHSMLTEYKENYRKFFRCKCYQKWSGSRCGRKILL